MSEVTERQFEEEVKEKNAKKELLNTIEFNKAAIGIFFVMILFAVFMEQPWMMIFIGIGVISIIASYVSLMSKLEKYIKERD